MSNVFFDAVNKEDCFEHPMYDAVLIDENGVQEWEHIDNCNLANNGRSVTKFFVSALIGILCDEKKLSLDDNVTKFFGADEKPADMDEKWNEVTVRQTLQHKTGIEHIPYGVDVDEHYEKIGYEKNDFIKYVFSLKIDHEPGTYRHYSDATYYLLCCIAHKVTGRYADELIREKIATPLHFCQWAMVKSPDGHPIGGDGLISRGLDNAKLAYTFACKGLYEGKRIISDEYIKDAMANDYALTSHRETDIYVKTGSHGQMVAFTQDRKCAVAWHGCSEDGNARNDRLLDAFMEYLDNKE